MFLCSVCVLLMHILRRQCHSLVNHVHFGSSILARMPSLHGIVLKNLLLTVFSSFAALCRSEVSSLAKPYLSEASGLVGVPCPEATRSVDMSRHHFACEGPVCRFCSSDSREDAWTTPIVVDYKLIECPSCFNTRCGGLFCPCASGDHSPPRSPGDPPEHQHRIKQPEGPRRVWRKPRQPDPPLICIPSSSTSQSPTQEVKL